MSWARYDDELPMNKKVGKLLAHGMAGAAALGLHVLANTWSRHNGTAGMIPAAQVGLLVGDARLGRRLAALLEGAGMFDVADGGWMVHDFDDFSDPDDDGRPASEKKKELSEKRAAAGRRGGLAKAGNRASKSVALPQQTSAPVPVPVPVPVPSYRIGDDDDSLPTHSSMSSSSSFDRTDYARAAACRLAEGRTDIVDRNAWLAGATRQIIAEHRRELDELVRSAATLDDAVNELVPSLDPVDLAGPPKPVHNPDCEACAGTGWAHTDPDDNTSPVAPCTCVDDRPLAPVHHIHGATA